MPNRFPKSAHVRKSADFDRVYEQDTYAADGVLVINAAANELGVTRLGMSISRKYGPAVVRNRWKRLIREAFRLSYSELPEGLDLVIRPKRGAEPVFEDIAKSLPQLVVKVARRLSQKAEVRSQRSDVSDQRPKEP
jgi:ribonuclease P protein component